MLAPGVLRRSPRAGRHAPSARAAAASAEVKPESLRAARADGRTGGRVDVAGGRRMGGRVGGASERATAARAGGTWVTARAGSSGGGARAAAAAHRVGEEGERMSRFKAAMTSWMMPVISDSIMTAGSRPRRHDARATASSMCVGHVRREPRTRLA